MATTVAIGSSGWKAPPEALTPFPGFGSPPKQKELRGTPPQSEKYLKTNMVNGKLM